MWLWCCILDTCVCVCVYVCARARILYIYTRMFTLLLFIYCVECILSLKVFIVPTLWTVPDFAVIQFLLIKVINGCRLVKFHLNVSLLLLAYVVRSTVALTLCYLYKLWKLLEYVDVFVPIVTVVVVAFHLISIHSNRINCYCCLEAMPFYHSMSNIRWICRKNNAQWIFFFFHFTIECLPNQ